MTSTTSKLFDRAGYIPLKEYLEDFDFFIKNNQWKLPFGYGDKLHLFFLKVIAKLSWFSGLLYIKHPSMISPVYLILIAYLQRNKFFDTLVERDLHCPGWYSFYLEKKILIRGREEMMSGQGVSQDKATALSIAIGEMIERSVTGLFDMNKKIFLDSPDELEKKSLIFYPPKYHQFLDTQKKKYKELNYESKDVIAWVQGENLDTGEIVYIPKQITSWFNENRNIKKVFIHSTTNGAAGYFNKDGAILRGLLEVVHRDSFLVHWLTMIPPQLLVEESLPENIQKKIREFEKIGITLYVLNSTAIPIPSILIVAINTQAEIPQVVISGASALTFEEAIDSALKEMVMMTEVFYYARHRAQDSSINNSVETAVSNLGKMDRQLYWIGKEKVKQFEWFIAGEQISYKELCRQDIISHGSDTYKLKECLKVLKNQGKGYMPVVYYPKNKVQKKLCFYVAQVYIPKAFPLYLLESYGTFNSERLREFALSKNRVDWTLNQQPHLFS